MKKILCSVLCLLILGGCNVKEETPTALDNLPIVEEETKIESKVDIPSFTITVVGKEITEKDMSSYELVKHEVKLVNSKGTEKEYTYEGYKITDILEVCGYKNLQGCVDAFATDGYEMLYKDNIILEDTLIALIRNGEVFEEGPWLAPCSSTTNGDYLKNVATIDIIVN